jgi:uncharacterized damage-inducible protein DinB
VSELAFPPLDITPMWARVNDELIELLDLLPDDKLDWSPQPGRWNARGILLHICIGRNIFTRPALRDVGDPPDVLKEGQTREGLKEQLRASWRRVEAFLSDAALLAREYDTPYQGKTLHLNGHWRAFGLLEHDIHHRADIVSYLDLLGIPHAEPDTFERRLKELLP